MSEIPDIDLEKTKSSIVEFIKSKVDEANSEGIAIGLVGGVIPMVLLFFGYSKLIAFVSGEFSLLTGVLQFLPVADVFRTLLPVAMILSVGIGFFGSFFTTRKHLRV